MSTMSEQHRPLRRRLDVSSSHAETWMGQGQDVLPSLQPQQSDHQQANADQYPYQHRYHQYQAAAPDHGLDQGQAEGQAQSAGLLVTNLCTPQCLFSHDGRCQEHHHNDHGQYHYQLYHQQQQQSHQQWLFEHRQEGQVLHDFDSPSLTPQQAVPRRVHPTTAYYHHHQGQQGQYHHQQLDQLDHYDPQLQEHQLQQQQEYQQLRPYQLQRPYQQQQQQPYQHHQQHHHQQEQQEQQEHKNHTHAPWHCFCEGPRRLWCDGACLLGEAMRAP
eukprot:m.17542 g.17542  ORF g.17542 m.17542 type:complete len:272 (+) comp5482_c0_seq2:309-1124(+)